MILFRKDVESCPLGTHVLVVTKNGCVHSGKFVEEFFTGYDHRTKQDTSGFVRQFDLLGCTATYDSDPYVNEDIVGWTDDVSYELKEI